MPAISKDSSIPYDLLWYISVDDDGWITTPDTIEFQVADSTQVVYPISGDPTVWKAGLLHSLGWYYPDWVPDVALPDGEYTITWRSTIDGVPVERSHDFNLVPAGEGQRRDTYISAYDVYNSALVDVDPADVPLEMVTVLIAVYQELIEEYCGQKFRPAAVTVKRKTEGEILHLIETIIGVATINEVTGLGTAKDFTEVLSDYVTIHHFQEDGGLRNPKLTRDSTSILTLEVQGIFGHLDPENWETPNPVRLALLKAVLKHAEELEADAALAPVGPVEEEQVDRHRIKYGGITSTAVGSLANVIFGSPEIRALLSMYRRPTLMRSV